FDNVSLLLLQIGLNADKDVALLVDRDAFDVFQLPAKSCNRLRLFARRVDIEFTVATIRDVERAFRKVDRLRAKRIAAIDNAVEFAIDRKSTRLNSSHLVISYA